MSGGKNSRAVPVGGELGLEKDPTHCGGHERVFAILCERKVPSWERRLAADSVQAKRTTTVDRLRATTIFGQFADLPSMSSSLPKQWFCQWHGISGMRPRSVNWAGGRDSRTS